MGRVHGPTDLANNSRKWEVEKPYLRVTGLTKRGRQVAPRNLLVETTGTFKALGVYGTVWVDDQVPIECDAVF